MQLSLIRQFREHEPDSRGETALGVRRQTPAMATPVDQGEGVRVEDRSCVPGADHGHVGTCPGCGNTGSTLRGSDAFGYRLAPVGGVERVRRCKNCDTGIRFLPAGGAELLSSFTWSMIQDLNRMLGYDD